MAGSPEHTQLHPRVLKGLSSKNRMGYNKVVQLEMHDWFTTVEAPFNIYVAQWIDLNLSAKFLEDFSIQAAAYFYIQRMHCFLLRICSMCTLHCKPFRLS